MDRWNDGRRNGKVDDGLMNEWMDGLMNGQMDCWKQIINVRLIPETQLTNVLDHDNIFKVSYKIF